MNSLSVVSLIAVLVLGGGAIFLGVKNRADALEAKKRLETLESQFATQKSGVQQAEVEKQLLAQERDRKQDEIDQLKEQFEQEYQERMVLDDQISRIAEGAPEEGDPQPRDETQRRVAAAAKIAEVTDAQPDLGFVVINAGAAKNVAPGQEYHLRRDNYLVGRVKIGDAVENNQSIADIVTIAEGVAIKAGDEVVQYVP